MDVGFCVGPVDAHAKVLSVFLNCQLNLILRYEITMYPLLIGFFIGETFAALGRYFTQTGLQVAIKVAR